MYIIGEWERTVGKTKILIFFIGNYKERKRKKLRVEQNGESQQGWKKEIEEGTLEVKGMLERNKKMENLHNV